MRVWSLFTGVGGFDAGLERAGHDVVFQCESDEWRRAILHHHWPDVPIADDVREVARPELDGRRGPVGGIGDGERRRGATTERSTGAHPDLICGGFPCQDLSVAGRRAGLDGERSGLFHEYARIVDTVRPRWVLIENVPGLLSSDGGRDFGIVLGTLVDIGYGVAWRILDSQYFGVPQRRRRVFILAHRVDGDPRAASGRAGQVLAVGTRCRRDHQTRGETRAGTTGGAAGSTRGYSPSETTPDIAGTLGGTGGGGVTTDIDRIGGWAVTAFHATQDPISSPSVVPAMGGEQNGVQYGPTVRRLTPRECERLQGFPDDWTLVPGVKCPDSPRYAAMGDAVTVPVAEWLGRRLAEVDG